jgi:Xaa-Pro aminopeptidase
MFNFIPASEFKERLANVQRQMEQRGLEALLIFSQKRGHVTYVTGYYPNYHTNSAIALVPQSGEPTLWVKFPFDLPRARATSWLSDIRGSASEEQEQLVSHFAEEVSARGLGRSHIGLVATDLAVDELSVSLSESVSTHLPKAQIVQASDLVNGLRLIKSKNEVDALRQASQLADLVANEFRKEIRPGVKTRIAEISAEHLARLEGAQDCSMILSTGPSNMALPPTDGEFKQQDVVTCEITVRYHGYWAQICRVFTIGKPSLDQKEIFAACKGGYEAARNAAQEGNSVSAALGATHKAITEAGFADYIQYGAGHGVGLDLPELYPLEAACQSALSSGMVLVIHPAIWVPGRGTAFVGGPVLVSNGRAVCLDTPQAEIVEV